MSKTDYVVAPRIPRGLAPAMEGLAREILRQRPRDIYTFAAEHFEGLVELRDKESRAAGIVSKILDCESLNERDPVSDWTTCNNCDPDNNDDDVKNRKYGKRMEEATMTKERVTSVMMTIMRKLPRKRRETVNGSGWSINRAVAVLKKYECGNDAEKEKHSCDGKLNMDGKEEKIADYSRQRSSARVSNKINGRGELIRSLSVGNVKRQLGGNRETSYSCAIVGEYTSRTNAERKCDYRDTKNSLKRQRSADRINGDLQVRRCFGGRRDEEVIVDRRRRRRRRRRSRSLVNEEDCSKGNGELSVPKERIHLAGEGDGRGSLNIEDRQWATTIEDRQLKGKKNLEGKFRSTEEMDGKLNIRLAKKKKEEEPKNVADVQRGDMFSDSETVRCDLSQGNIYEHDARMNVSGCSVVFPSVVTRSSSGRCIRRRDNAYEFNEDDNSGNLTLPPILSDDASKMIKRESDLTLPSLSIATDAVARATCDCNGHRHEDFVNSSVRDRKKEAEFEQVFGNTESTSPDRGIEETVEACCGKKETEENAGSNGNEIVAPWVVHVWQGKCDGETTEVLDQLEIIRRDSSSEEATDVEEETFNDSLNVTPDSIDLSQRPDSLEYRSEEKNNGSTVVINNWQETERVAREGERQVEEEEKEEREKLSCRSNELKRRLMEIETVERSIEHTLISSSTSSSPSASSSSRTITTCDNPSMTDLRTTELYELGKNEIVFAAEMKSRRALYVDGERVKHADKKKRDKKNCSETVTTENFSNGINRDSGDRDVDDLTEMANEGGVSLNDDNNTNNTSTDESNIQETTSHVPLQDFDRSSYLLAEGAPCEVPKAVTTVLVPEVTTRKAIETIENAASRPKTKAISSSCDLVGKRKELEERQQQQQHDRDRRRHDTTPDPFGENVRSEVFDYSTSIDPYVKPCAVDRTSDYQDLGNIKEEEEGNENDNLTHGLYCSERALLGSWDDKNGIESKARMTTISNDRTDVEIEHASSDIFTNTKNNDETLSIGSRTVNREEETNDAVAKNEEEEKEEKEEEEEEEVVVVVAAMKEGEASNDRTDPLVPELNLDSLTIRDTTISSPFKRNDSKNPEDRSNEQHAGDVTCCWECENISSLSLRDTTTLASGQRTPIDGVTSSSENKIGTSEEHRDHRPTDGLNADKDGRHFCNVEEEIARELIENFIRDATIRRGNLETRHATFWETSNSDSLLPISVYQPSNRNEMDDLALTFYPCVRELATSGTVIEDEIDKNVQVRREENEEEGKKDGEEKADEAKEQVGNVTILSNKGSHNGRSSDGGERRRREGLETEKPKKCRKSVGAKKEEKTNLRHSGEFHDSFLLPFPFTVDVYDLNRGATFGALARNSCLAAYRSNFDENSESRRTTAPYGETRFDSGSDDPREPLVLDNTPKPPIVIEEISNVEEEKEQASSLYRTGTNSSKEVNLFPPKKHYYSSSDLNANGKMLFPVSSSTPILIYGTKRSVGSHDLLLNTFVNSSTFRNIVVVGHVAEEEREGEGKGEEEGEGEDRNNK